MKAYNSLFFLLFVLLIMGSFASMAQNSYGLKILGGVAILFGLTFLVRAIEILTKNDNADIYAVVELFSLLLLSLIFTLRILYIHFPYIELIFAFAGMALMYVYLRKMILQFQYLKSRNALLAITVLSFYLSIVLFLVSMIAAPFFQTFSFITGGIAFALLIAFLVAGFFVRNILIEGEKVSAFRLVTHTRDCSIIVITLFFLFSLYTGLTSIGAIPRIYSDEYPQAYLELVNKAESGNETPLNGRFRHQDFKQKYDEFVKRNLLNRD